MMQQGFMTRKDEMEYPAILKDIGQRNKWEKNEK